MTTLASFHHRLNFDLSSERGGNGVFRDSLESKIPLRRARRVGSVVGASIGLFEEFLVYGVGLVMEESSVSFSTIMLGILGLVEIDSVTEESLEDEEEDDELGPRGGGGGRMMTVVPMDTSVVLFYVLVS